MLKNRWTMIALVFAVWALGTSLIAGYYLLQYNDLSQQTSGLRITVNIGVDYGNSTRTYYNDTQTWTGKTLLDVSKQVANVEAQAGAYGTEVTGINGVTKQGAYGWTYWTWNSTSQLWSIVWEGGDAYKVANGETLMWYYQNGFNPPP